MNKGNQGNHCVTFDNNCPTFERTKKLSTNDNFELQATVFRQWIVCAINVPRNDFSNSRYIYCYYKKLLIRFSFAIN